MTWRSFWPSETLSRPHDAPAVRPWRALTAPRDVRALTLACVAFVLFGAALSRAIGAPFVLPAGESPALGTNFALPLVAAVLGYVGLLVGANVVRGAAADEAPWRRRVADDLYLLLLFVIVVYVHFHVKMWVPLVNPRHFDADYYAVDTTLRPVIDVLGWARAGLADLLPHADVWYVLGFFSMFSLSFWFHAASRRHWHYHNMVALALTEIVGAIAYLAAPAVGPFVFEHGPNALATAGQVRMYAQYQELQRDGAAWLAAHGGSYFTAPLAAMPSLHLAAAFVMAYYAVRARLVIAPYAVAVVVWITVESVVSRWHYLVDLPAGLVLAAFVIAVTNRLCRHRVASATAVAARRTRAQAQPAAA